MNKEEKMKTKWDQIKDLLDDLEFESEKKDDESYEIQLVVVDLKKEVEYLEGEIERLEKEAGTKNH